MRRVILMAWCASGMGVVTGCGGESFPVAPVHGVVSIDNKPLFQGKVMFAPIAKGGNNPGKPAWSEISPEGTYRLTTFKKDDGAVIGDHWVTIINSKEELPEDVPEFGRFMVPKPATVSPGKDNQIDIKLTSQIVEKYMEDDR